ncbi:hypothetical protein I8752_03285 [Nostocaceae cyanobacterium CENA369]|uniref:Uncharacterized protein n=1 Tax=Dendronalium phyllosphericum CENA369 TaxID=1725256 RepID=A0A8J7HXN1_9NOST|nr:hypothetical protein [Dendronalium phyllosphericum]MBH8572070.1 hypothetical protein [Dendronalium phyllosphericum CENA369]
MNINPRSLIQYFPKQFLLLLLSLLDDVLLLGFSHLGLHLQWLKWLSPVILYGTILYFFVQIIRYLSKSQVL